MIATDGSTVVPRCYYLRRDVLWLFDEPVQQAVPRTGWQWSVTTFPDAAAWRMDCFARLCDVHIDDIHAFETAPGEWRYCFRYLVRPFAPYTLEY